MAFSDSAKEKILVRLFSKYGDICDNQIPVSLYETMKQQPGFKFGEWKEAMEKCNFTRQIKCEIEYIEQKGLYKNVENWGEKCREARISCGLTLEDVARELIDPRDTGEKVLEELDALQGSVNKSLSDGHKKITKKLQRKVRINQAADEIERTLDNKQKKVMQELTEFGEKLEKIYHSRSKAVHNNVANQEKTTEKTTVDLFYLQAFSLIYKRAPLIFLGAKSEMTPAIYFTNGPYWEVIINTLYHPENEEKIRYLHLLTAIGVMPDSNFDRFWAALQVIPAFQGKLGLEDHFDQELTQTIPPEKPEQLGEPGTWEFLHKYVFLEAFSVARDLERLRADRMRCLARLAVIQPQPRHLLETLLRDGGFLEETRGYIRHIRRWIRDPKTKAQDVLHPILEGGEAQPTSLWPAIKLIDSKNEYDI